MRPEDVARRLQRLSARRAAAAARLTIEAPSLAPSPNHAAPAPQPGPPSAVTASRIPTPQSPAAPSSATPGDWSTLRRRIDALRSGGAATWPPGPAAPASAAPSPAAPDPAAAEPFTREPAAPPAPPAPPPPRDRRAADAAFVAARRAALADPEAAPPADRSVAGRLAGLRASAGLPPSVAAAASPTTVAEQLARLRRGDAAALPDGPQAARLMALLPGEVRATPHGECFVVVHRYGLDARHGDRPLLAALERDGAGAAIAGGDAALGTFDLRRALFVDLETTGLARAMGTLPFLIGAAHLAGDQLVLEQWLLRDPDDEPAALADFGARLADADHLVTYNGRAFDLPLLQVRYAGLGLADPSADLGAHFDLLTAVRRLLRHRLPDCRLATVEAHLLGLIRVDDAPGSEAPRRYRGYLFGDDPAPLLPIIAHNRDDILSMVTLVDALLDRVDRIEGGVLHDPDCALALARQAERAGAWAFADRVYAAATDVPEAAERARRGARRVARAVAKAARS